MTDIRPLPHILESKPYAPGGKLAFKGEVALMASNENPLGASPKAVAAMRTAAEQVNIYPDPTYSKLRSAIGEVKGISDVSRIVVSSGSDEIIHLLVQCYAGPGDEVLHTEHAFSMYAISAKGHGATPIAVPETDMTAGANALLGAVSERTRLLFLANPNNPTGTMMSVDKLAALQDELPPHVLLVIDGAYAEYLGDEYEAELRDLVEQRGNTIMMRTFSKIYGLAALRLGWAYMPAEITEIFQRIRGPFNVNGLAAVAGTASIQDVEFIANSRAHNDEWRTKLTGALNAMGLSTPHSDANFVIPDFGSDDKAAAAHAYLKERGILVRALAGYGLPTRLRITVGTEVNNLRVLEALKVFTDVR